MNNNYYKWNGNDSFGYISISFGSTNNSSNNNTTSVSYKINYGDLASSFLQNSLSTVMYFSGQFSKDTLGTSNVHKTHIPQAVEERLIDYVSELDKCFIEQIGWSMHSYLQEKCYEITCEVVRDELGSNGDYCLAALTTEEDIIEEVIDSIDFSVCDEIICDILKAPCTLEEKLREIGMSMKDFL